MFVNLYIIFIQISPTSVVSYIWILIWNQPISSWLKSRFDLISWLCSILLNLVHFTCIWHQQKTLSPPYAITQMTAHTPPVSFHFLMWMASPPFIWPTSLYKGFSHWEELKWCNNSVCVFHVAKLLIMHISVYNALYDILDYRLF